MLKLLDRADKLGLLMGIGHAMVVAGILLLGWVYAKQLFVGYVLVLVDFPISVLFYNVIQQLFLSTPETPSETALAWSNFFLNTAHLLIGSIYYYAIGWALSWSWKKTLKRKRREE